MLSVATRTFDSFDSSLPGSTADRKNGIVIVDVRALVGHRWSSIAAAIHMPLGLLKAKVALARQPVVLLHDGLAEQPLAPHLQKFRSVDGLRLVRGGIVSWRQHGGPMEQADGGASVVGLVSSPALFEVFEDPGWLLVEAKLEDGPSIKDFPGAVATIQFGKLSFARDLNAAIRRNPGTKRVLVFNARGEGYREMDQAVMKMFDEVNAKDGGWKGGLGELVKRGKLDEVTVPLTELTQSTRSANSPTQTSSEELDLRSIPIFYLDSGSEALNQHIALMKHAEKRRTVRISSTVTTSGRPGRPARSPATCCGGSLK